MVRRQIIFGVLLVILIALLLVGIYHGTRAESKQITGVDVVGGQTIPHSQIKQIVQDTLVGNYYRLIPRTFTWTYPEGHIAENISAIDRIKNVQVSLEKRRVLVVYEEYIPYALWCTDTNELCYFIDRLGLAFASAPPLSGSAFVRYSETGRPPELGAMSFDTDYLRNNEAFVQRLEEELGLYVTNIQKAGDYDIDYRVSGGGLIKVSQTMELDETFRNLLTVLQSEEFIHLEPGKFQYIDLRFGNKVFVNEELPSVSPATTTAGS